MGKGVGLVGALTTIGAVAYLMAPVPPSAVDMPKSQAAGQGGAAETKVAVDAVRPVSPGPSSDPLIRLASTQSTTRTEPTVVLVQQIQGELQRLGCYVGPIDGRWTDATQRAMQALGERVSVLRPVDTPDYIMLALARGQSSTVCTPTTQRSAAAKPRDKWAAIAAPEIAGPGKGEVRPTNGTTRVAAAEPDSASTSAQPKVWRALPDAPPKRATARETGPSVDAVRLKAARDELMRIETRKRATQAASAVPQAPVAAPVETASAESRPLPESSRMSLGVAPSDPLLAHIDPRNPNAPAILRSPPQPLPHGASLQGVDRPTGIEAAPPSATPPSPTRTANARPAKPELSASDTKKRAKREWMRNVFTNMRFNGP
jgi:hypothetical protein